EALDDDRHTELRESPVLVDVVRHPHLALGHEVLHGHDGDRLDDCDRHVLLRTERTVVLDAEHLQRITRCGVHGPPIGCGLGLGRSTLRRELLALEGVLGHSSERSDLESGVLSISRHTHVVSPWFDPLSGIFVGCRSATSNIVSKSNKANDGHPTDTPMRYRRGCCRHPGAAPRTPLALDPPTVSR